MMARIHVMGDAILPPTTAIPGYAIGFRDVTSGTTYVTDNSGYFGHFFFFFFLT